MQEELRINKYVTKGKHIALVNKMESIHYTEAND